MGSFLPGCFWSDWGLHVLLSLSRGSGRVRKAKSQLMQWRIAAILLSLQRFLQLWATFRAVTKQRIGSCSLGNLPQETSEKEHMRRRNRNPQKDPMTARFRMHVPWIWPVSFVTRSFITDLSDHPLTSRPSATTSLQVTNYKDKKEHLGPLLESQGLAFLKSNGFTLRIVFLFSFTIAGGESAWAAHSFAIVQRVMQSLLKN